MRLARFLGRQVARLSWRQSLLPLRPHAVRIAHRLGAVDHLKRRNMRVMGRHIARREVELTSFPSVLQVEHTTVCNLRCRMCSIVRPSRRRELAHLQLEDLERLRPILPYVQWVKLNGGGEPFLVPDIERFLEIFQSYGVRLNTTTNATLITERIARIIGESFSELIVSMDGATPETYEMIRVNSRFDHVVRAFERINAHRRPELRLKIGFVAMRCNIHELPALVEFARRHQVNSVHVSWVVPFNDLPWTHDQDPALEPEHANEFLGKARAVAQACGIELEVPPDLPLKPRAPTCETTTEDLDERPVATYGKLLSTNRVAGFCHIMYDRAMILLDGRVKPCCHSREFMGSIRTQEFAAIWNGPAYQELRASFWRGILPGSCSSCNFLRSGQLPGARLLPADSEDLGAAEA